MDYSIVVYIDVYLFSLQVDRIFRDRTIGNSINLVLVQRVILLPKSEVRMNVIHGLKTF